MSQISLDAHSGRPTGSASSRRLRAEGHIPGVIYGHGMTPVSISVERRDLRLALSGPGGVNTLLSIKVDGKKYPAIVKEMQRHPIRRTVSHIDFLQVNVNEEITIAVPVHLVGEAKAVLNEGGMVDPAVDSLDIVCTPNTMPTEILIDISAMQPGDVIRLADVTLPAGTSATADPDMAVVTTIQSSASIAEAAESAEAAPAAPDAE